MLCSVSSYLLMLRFLLCDMFHVAILLIELNFRRPSAVGIVYLFTMTVCFVAGDDIQDVRLMLPRCALLHRQKMYDEFISCAKLVLFSYAKEISSDDSRQYGGLLCCFCERRGDANVFIGLNLHSLYMAESPSLCPSPIACLCPSPSQPFPIIYTS